MARELGLTTLGTLHERIGDTATSVYPEGEGYARSMWARYFGQQVNNRYEAFADPRTSGVLQGVQAGFDLARTSVIPGHRDFVGVYFAYGNTNVDVNGLVTNAAATGYVLTKTGTLNLNAYSGGAYWTHYGPGGWYLDMVVQATAYDGSVTAQSSIDEVSTALGTRGSGFISSLEGGYPIPLAFGPNFVLEPQAQIIWQHVGFTPGNDAFGSVALGTTSGATGRLGLRGQWTIPSAYGGVWQPYVRANLWQDWGAQAVTDFAGSPVLVPLDEQATRLEFAGGLTYKLNGSLSFYGQGGYDFAVAPNNIRRDGVKGDFGLRWTW
jgi:outer membrane autotransporter protein